MTSCSCVSCDECKGSGVIWVAVDGSYLGCRRCDDLDDVETCNECGGIGLTEICQECRDKYDEEMNNERWP